MATEPTVCDEIHPAVTHTISWQVAATPHSSDYYKVGYYQPATIVDAAKNFQEWLISEGVTGTPVVFADGHVRTATWFNKNYENPVYHTCQYILQTNGIGTIQIFDGTANSKEFRNLQPYQYAGNSSDGSVIIDYNDPNGGNDYLHLFQMPFVMALNAIRAIDHVDATIATAYPMATRVLTAPPPPLTEGLFGLEEKISLTASFKLFVEYQGPDRQKSMWVNAPNTIWTYAFGKNEATTNWGYDYKPYKNIGQITEDYYGSVDFKQAFFDDVSDSQIMEGEYKILTYPWREATNGNVSYQFPDNQSFTISLSGQSGAISEFSNFYRNEAYLHNHVWNAKFMRYVALDCELVTVPPLLPKITEISHWIETLQFPNTGSNAATYPYVYQYRLHLSYKSTYAKEVTRYEIPSDIQPDFEIFDRDREYPWTGAVYEDLPTPIAVNQLLYLSPLDAATVNLTTNQQKTDEYWGRYEEEDWSPTQENENDNRYWSYHYKIRVQYANIGQHQPESIKKEGWTEWEAWHGAHDQDAPDTLQDFLAGVPDSAITYKAFGIYEQGEYSRDWEHSVGGLAIDCSAIGGINPSRLAEYTSVYKTAFAWPTCLPLPTLG